MMRKILILAIVCMIATGLHTQTTIFTEDWENGIGDWQIVNLNSGGTQNFWFLGEAQGAHTGPGTHSMYITNNGVSNVYSIDYLPVRAFFHRNIALPFTTANIVLNFDIRCIGEAAFDYVRVYMMPTSVTPVASSTSLNINETDPYGQYRIGEVCYNVSNLAVVGGWNNVNITIPSTWHGQTGRLVFVWNNNAQGGMNPPAAIDNLSISLHYLEIPPAPAALVEPLDGGNYISVQPTLSWLPDVIGTPATGYTLNFGESAVAMTPVYIGTQTTYTPSEPLAHATTYYWQVIPYNTFGDAIECPVWCFTTITDNIILLENWENGIGDWVIVNHDTRINKWHLGEATYTGIGSTHSMYITNDGGLTNAYTVTGQSVRAFIYRDIAFTSALSEFLLNLDIKVQGDGPLDYVRVYMMPTSITPEASLVPLGANANDPNEQYIIGESYYNKDTLPSGTQDVWNNVDINIPSSWSGQTGRLVFTWNNDGEGGAQPPVAIDNLSITWQPLNAPPAPAAIGEPLNGASLISVQPTFSWVPDTFATPATGYILYLGETIDAMTTVYIGSQTTYTPSAPLAHSTTYYWQVVPFNSFGDAIACPVWSFTTIAGNIIFSEYWENGIGEWVIVNHDTRLNKWQLGEATSESTGIGSGTHSMYISNDGGLTNAYTITSQSVRASIYRDIAFLDGVSDIVLNLDIKVQGQGTDDYVRIYLMPTSIAPEASLVALGANANDPNAQYRIGNSYYNSDTLPSGDQDVWNNVNIGIPSSWSGQTGRLVFTWNNDGEGGVQPPVAIDNLSITYQPLDAPPAPAALDVPLVGDNLIEVQPTFRWIPDAFATPATDYTLYLGESADTMSPVYTGTQTTYTPSEPLAYDTTFYWQVVPFNSFGDAIDCPIWHFTTITENTMFTEDWEKGLGDWVIVNLETRPNKWHLGEATSIGTGTHSMYITNDGGLTNAYTITSQSVRSHIYRDIAFPASVRDIVLNLEMKVQGDGTNDYVRVYMMPTSVTPVAGTASLGANANDPNAQYRIGNSYYNRDTLPSGDQDDWNNLNISIPSTWSGQTGRLVFTWNNDGSGGFQPPVAIDKLTITYISIPPAVYTVGGVLQRSPESTHGSVAGLTVTLQNNDDNNSSPTPVTSGEGGEFSFPAVQAGEYTLSVSLAGATPYTHVDAITVTNSDILNLVIVVPPSLTEGDLATVPMVTVLRANYPNPFNPTTAIAFDMACSGHVVIEVYNIKGQRVCVLADAEYAVGRHNVVWNGDDAAGRSVGSGVYFYRMNTQGYQSVRKMLLLK